jgi:hypothetical protein
MGSLNVDATAAAPAKKVAGRASVVLLEPDAAAINLGQAWASLTGGRTAIPTMGAGVPWFGDPREILHRASALSIEARIQKAVEAEVDAIHNELPAQVVTQRSIRQCLLYAAAAVAVRSARTVLTDDDYVIGARNALLHHVLPGMEEPHFRIAVDYVNSKATTPESLLSARLTRLTTDLSDDDFGGPRDFWARLC